MRRQGGRRPRPKTLAAHLAWLRDVGDALTCCERATDAEIEEEPEAYDCATCELAQQRAALSAADLDALDCYRLLALPVVRDMPPLVPLVFELLGLRCTRTQAQGLLLRLNVIHEDRPVAAEDPNPETHG